MDDTAEDKKAIQAPLSKVMFYPLSQFNGSMKTTDWSRFRRSRCLPVRPTSG